MLASWVQQAAFEPPAVSVAIKKGRPIVEYIDESRAFVVNVIGESTGPMFKHFGKGFGPGEEAFAGLSIHELPEGLVLDDCIAHLAVRVLSRAEAGDHWVYVAQITQGGASDAAPYVHLRKNGLSY
jgi:flavin reductase (DIM6/NTAB) family NADH-FMN oxidoreductase RutF